MIQIRTVGDEDWLTINGEDTDISGEAIFHLETVDLDYTNKVESELIITDDIDSDEDLEEDEMSVLQFNNILRSWVNSIGKLEDYRHKYVRKEVRQSFEIMFIKFKNLPHTSLAVFSPCLVSGWGCGGWARLYTSRDRSKLEQVISDLDLPGKD